MKLATVRKFEGGFARSAVFAEDFKSGLKLADKCRHIREHRVLMFESIIQLRFQVRQERIRCLRCIAFEVVQELIRKIGILCELVIEVLHPLLPHFVLLFDIVLHIIRFILDLLNNFLLLRNPQLLLLDKSILDSLQLGPNRIQVVVVVLDTILSLLIYASLALVHPRVVIRPLLSENISFFVYLAFQIVS